MKIVAALLTLLAVASCSTVVSRQPVGAKPVDFSKHALEGIWADEDGEELALIVKDGRLGTMAMLSGAEEGDEEELQIRETGGVLFANLKEDNEPSYGWVRLRLKGDLLQADMPDPHAFAALVKAEQVEGRILEAEERLDAAGVPVPNGGITVVLDDPAGAWVAKLVDGTLGKPWTKGDKTVLKRVRRIR